MSSAMLSLKVLSTLQQSTPLGLFSSPLGSMHGSASSLTTSSNRRSVLHPDNQRALARQGFYGDNLPEGIEPGDMPVRREGAGEDEVSVVLNNVRSLLQSVLCRLYKSPMDENIKQPRSSMCICLQKGHIIMYVKDHKW